MIGRRATLLQSLGLAGATIAAPLVGTATRTSHIWQSMVSRTVVNGVPMRTTWEQLFVNGKLTMAVRNVSWLQLS